MTKRPVTLGMDERAGQADLRPRNGGAAAPWGESPLATAVPGVSALGRVKDRLRPLVRAIRAHPTGRIALKVAVAVVGGLVIALGLVLIPLPGPGWALVILGLAIWAIEFVWAKHLLRFTRDRVRRWTRWVGRQPWPLRLVIVLGGLAFVSAVCVASLKYGAGVDLLVGWRHATTN